MLTLSSQRFCMALLFLLSTNISLASDTPDQVTVAVIGTGDMGNSLGPRFAELGYTVVYGSRNPGSERDSVVTTEKRQDTMLAA